LCSPLSSPLSFCSLSFFSSSLPLFLKTKIGEGRGWGGHCVAAPPTCGKCGLCRRLFKGKDGDDRGGRRRRHMVPFKITPFLLHFFLFEMYETTLFFSKHIVSFMWELVPKRIRFKIKPLICALCAFWFLVSDFFK
jgi:hypothetical protein